MMQDIARKDAECIYAQNVGLTVVKSTENALSDAIHVEFQFANNGLKSISFSFAENLLAGMAQNGSLNYLSDHYFKPWAQSVMAVDAFAICTLTSFLYVWPRKRLIRESVEMQTDECYQK